jgi:tetratricopeptide (TPR) repeat protein
MRKIAAKKYCQKFNLAIKFRLSKKIRHMLKTKYFSTLFLLFVLSSFAVSAKDNWIRVQSKNFHLIGNASEKDIRKVATRLEQFRETFRRLMTQASFDSAIPTNVIVFKSNSAYKPFKPKRADGKIDDYVAGFFQPGRDVNYITLSTEGESTGQMYETIFHEYIHFLVNVNFGKTDVPAWFNEGIAEYYSTFEIEKDQIAKLGIFQQSHIDLLSRSKLMPLADLFAVSKYQLLQQGNHSRSIFYAQSWALLHYLYQHPKPEVRNGVGKFIDALAQKVQPEQALQTAFQMNYAQMEGELKKYVNKSSYQFQIYPFKEKLVFDSEMKVSPLSEGEANAYLGDLLAHTRRHDDAEPYLQKALTLEPDSSLANTALGMVKFRQRKYAEAKTYLEKAIAGDSKNHLAYYNYAYILSRERQDEFGWVSSFSAETVAKMRDSLKKAININPAYTESYELYAFINLVNQDDLNGAVEMLKTALKYQPGDQQIILRIAEIFARQEKFADAKQLAQRISETTDEPETKSRADNLLSNIVSNENIGAQNEAARKRYEEERKQYEAQRNQPKYSSNGPTRLVRRQPEMSAEDAAKAAETAHFASITQALKQPATNEKQIIGKITKIACPPKMIVYTVKTETETISLFSKDFQNLALVSFEPKAEAAKIGCNLSLAAYNSVLTYKTSTAAKSTYSGELTAIDFVPANFRFVKENNAETLSIVEDNQVSTVSENPPPNLKNDNQTVENNSPPQDFEAQRREMMLESLKNALRQPQAGETRLTGMLEKIECDKNGQFFVFKTADSQLLKLKSPQGLQIRSFVPDIAGMQFECGMKQFNANVVFTYKPNTDKKAKFNGDLVALEFVPNSFKLE